MLWLIYCSVRRRTNKFSFDLSFSSNQLYELIERKIPNILALLHLHTVVFFSLASYFMPVQRLVVHSGTLFQNGCTLRILSLNLIILFIQTYLHDN